MKTSRILLLCSLLTVHCSLSAQQYGWKDISANIPPIPGDTAPRILTDMYFINDNEGWISTLQNQNDSSFILHTTDGGQTFELQKTQYGCETIHMLNENVGYAGGYMGRVYRTTDGGENWIPIGSTGSTVLDITFPPVGDTGYLCSGTVNGQIYLITPSGLTQMDENIPDVLSSISFPINNQEGWVCGGSVLIHFINNAWIGDQFRPAGGYNAIVMVDTLLGWAVGDGGIIIRTTDGQNWYEQSSPNPHTYFDVFFLNSNEGWATGFGQIIHTADGGNTWTEQLLVTGNQLLSVFFTSATIGYACGMQNRLLKYSAVSGTEDHQGEWEKIALYPNPTTGQFKVQRAKGKVEFQSLELVDIYGKVLISNNNITIEQLNNGTIECDISEFPSGIYFIRINLENQTTVKKITKL